MIQGRCRLAVGVVVLAGLSGCGAPDRDVQPDDIRDRVAQVECERLGAAPPYSSAMALPTPTAATAWTPSSRDEPLRLVDMSAPPAASSAPGRAERGPRQSFGSTLKRDLKDMPHDLWSDTKRVYGNPINLAILGVTYGGSLALQESGPDNTVERHFNHHHTYSGDWPDAFGALGNPAVHFGLAGLWYLAGQQTQNDKTYEVGKALFSALIINGVTVMVGQTASWDRSPNGEWGTFPSGHTSSTFVVASVMHEAYGPVVGIPLYALGTLVAIERLDDREHYFSDVVMGAVLGTVIGHSVAGGRDPEFFGFKVLPYIDPSRQASGIALYKTLD